MTEEAQRIERIIQKHAHDVRNSLCGLNLQAVLLGEVSTDPEVTDTVRRMCAELTQLEATVKALQCKFSKPAPLTFTSADLLNLWQRQITPLETASRRISWSVPLVARELMVDAHAIISVMREIVLEAWWRAPISALKAAVITTDQDVVMELREPIPSTPPAAKEMEQHQRIIAIHGGTLEVSEDALAGERITALSFPVLKRS